MPLHKFRLIVDEVPTEEQVDALLALADQPSGGKSPREGIGVVWFDRDAPSLAEAIESAVYDLELLGMRPVRVENRDWVTLGEIAERIGRSREIVRLWSAGRQGPGGFPPPLNPDPDPKTTFYSWAEVAHWLRQRMNVDLPEVEPVLAAANHVLQVRSLAPRIEQIDAIRRLLAARTTGGAERARPPRTTVAA